LFVMIKNIINKTVPIAVYKKAPIKYRSKKEAVAENNKIIIQNTQVNTKQSFTLWDMLSGIANDLSYAIIRSRVAGFLLPLILIFIGSGILYREIWPRVEQEIKYAMGYYDVNTVPLVAGDYIEQKQYLSNPGADYFAELNADAESSHVLQPDPISNAFNAKFTLSIPALGLSNLPVTSNVDSGNKTVYDSVLNTGLAHFEGTGLPISNVENNIVIYGHSSSGDYYERTRDVAGAFSKLNEVKIGDIIDVNIDGKAYQYRIYKTKVVLPDDISIVTGQRNRRTLTLFTCFPNGNNANRFVVVAVPV